MSDAPDAPVTESSRIEGLDVLRGFALLGILLLNILGFGMLQTTYLNPGIDLIGGSSLDVGVWASVDVLAEGAMRCLFSMLFGAGVVLFTSDDRPRALLHYKRNFWLLAFGLFDAFILLWNGDILVTYAIAGAGLFLFRNRRPRTLIVMATVLIVLLTLAYTGMRAGMNFMRDAAATVGSEGTIENMAGDDGVLAAAAAWQEFRRDNVPTAEEIEAELLARRDSYASAFAWNLPITIEFLTFVLPAFLIWDALAMMLLGMAFYKAGILHATRSRSFYVKMMAVGFGLGIAINSVEVAGGIINDFDLLSVFPLMQPTYQLGRLGMACGYLALLMLIVQSGALPTLRRWLANVGRMALTNYLMQSFICMLIFTGAGFALVGELSRAGLYVVVIGIWIFQLTMSTWWMARFRFGPVEWLWRVLTYGKLQPMRRAS